MEKIKQKVKQLLTEHPTLRDNVDTLIREVLTSEGINVANASIVSALYKKAATIDRMSRLIQETQPELRGKKRLERLAKAEEVKEQIKELKSN